MTTRFFQGYLRFSLINPELRHYVALHASPKTRNSTLLIYSFAAHSLQLVAGPLHWGHPLSEDVPLEEFLHRVLTRMPRGVTEGDSGLCRCLPCLSSAIISLCWFFTGAPGFFLFQFTTKLHSKANMHISVYMRVYILSQFRDPSVRIKIGSVLCLYTPV